MRKLIAKIKTRIKVIKSIKNRNDLLRKMPKNAICAEIGAWKGDFSSEIISKTNPSKLFIIDPYMHVESYEGAWYGGEESSQQKMDQVYEGVRERFKTNIKAGLLEIVRDDSTAALSNFEDLFFDWIYIDGNHLYEYVKADLVNSYKKVKVGGYITGDDYNLAGWWDDGVTKAVDEFVKEMPQEIKLISIKGTQFILKKIG